MDAKPSTKWLNFFERVLWTLLQVASAEGLIQIYQQVAHVEVAAIWTVVLTVVLSAIKNAAAQAFGSPTGATLPTDQQPVLAEKVLPAAHWLSGLAGAILILWGGATMAATL